MPRGLGCNLRGKRYLAVMNTSADHPQVSPPLEVASLANGGEGIVRWEGKVYFVADTAPGDVVRIRPTIEKKTHGFAVVHSMEERSSLRRPSPCEHFPACGGCSWLHLPEEVQREAKARFVAERFRNLLSPEEIEPLRFLPMSLAYRHRATFHRGPGGWGFYRAGTNEVEALRECHVVTPELLAALKVATEQPATLGDASSLVALSDGEDVHLMATGDRSKPPGMLRYAEGALTSLASNRYLSGELRGAAYAMRVDAFVQNCPAACELLANEVRRWTEEVQPQRVLDLYGGIGLHGLVAAQGGAAVTTVESNAIATACAIETGRRNGYEAAQWEPVTTTVEAYCPDRPQSHDHCIVNPPRTGLSRRVADRLKASALKSILYVSCDPATQARDVARLASGGYSLMRLQPLDIFPQTSHVECVAALQRP